MVYLSVFSFLCVVQEFFACHRVSQNPVCICLNSFEVFEMCWELFTCLPISNLF